MKRIVIRKNLVFFALLALFLFFYSYRYIFRINDSGTSPTYADTPTLVSYSKYILLVIILGFTVFFIKKIKINIKKSIILILALQSFYAFIVTKESSVLVFFVLMTTLFIFMFTDFKINMASVSKLFSFFIYFCLIYEFIQIILYFASGRLPALAYPTGIFTDVRFGGAWDDPNGFSILINFLFLFSIYYYKGMKRVFILSALAVCLLLTWSLTGWFVFAIVMTIWFLMNYQTINRRTKLGLAVILACIFIFAILRLDDLMFFLDKKMPSIYQHLGAFTLNNISPLSFFGILPMKPTGESGIVRLLHVGGILHFVLFLMLGIMSIKNLYCASLTLKRKKKAYGLIIGALFYQIAFLIACINLPLNYSFSTLGIFIIFVYISFRFKRNHMKYSRCK